MGTNRGQLILLAVLVGAAGLLGYRALPISSDDPPPAAERTPRAVAQRRTASTSGAPDVHLQALDTPRPKPVSQGRDLFRFKPKPLPPPPPVVPAPVVIPVPTEPPPPRLPPIPYRFIGYVEEQGRKTAVLSDGQHPPVRGREGDLVEGRYRILRIGSDSIEMAYADGRGRQTIRLQGS